MDTLRTRLDAVAEARRKLIGGLSGVTDAQAIWQPGEGMWSIAQVVEHLVLAEYSGVIRIWQAVTDRRNGGPVWEGEPIHCGETIETIIARTWRPHEDAPPIATPQWNGPLGYWIACLDASQQPLEALGRELAGLDLAALIAPHFLSGPLDADQRLQFLRWHIEHHGQQISDVAATPGFP